MTGESQLERGLTELFQADVPVQAPIDLHAAAMTRVARRRQRPAFVVVVLRGGLLPAATTRVGRARTLVLVGAALILVAVVGAVIAGGSAVTPVPLAQPTPEIIIPAGVTSTQTIDDVIFKTMRAIAANEEGVGRALAPVRIIRIQLLRPGDSYVLRRLDGTGSLEARGLEWGEPAWVVEAVGTFVDPIGRDFGSVTSMGAHGFYMWGDIDGNHRRSTYDWFPCWVRTADEPRADNMEGQCAPPAP